MSQYKSWYSAKGCRKCELIINSKLKPTMGLGFNKDSTTDIMFIGEAPGYKEMKTQIPFIGKSGQLLRKYIKDSRLDDVSYITNVIKCRPPENRTPTEYEINVCGYHLAEEIKMFKPKIIVLLGKIAILRFREYNKKLINTISQFEDGIIFMYMYHPSYIIREGNTEIYDEAFKRLRAIYAAINILYIADL